ncbi:MAG: hypothetical protein DUD39_10680 [Coriobacteriaceae bacterium]|jgi:superfamily II DNA or RNA helicase|nr:MAG: hypothetical protein DUD39_10680 [Coriobacteriaceae bacterium]
MMDSLKDIPIKHSYFGKGTHILHEFLLPLMDAAVRYDRVTSFFTIDSLLAVSQGIQSLFERGGHMRLIIGVHSFPPELADAALRKEYMSNQIAEVRSAIEEGIETIGDALERKRLATLAWMIEDNLLEVKAAAVSGGDGIFHPKTLIFADDYGNRIAAVGSPNETPSGLGGNFEQLMVAKSWEAEDGVKEQEEFFELLWENKSEDAIVADVTDELAETLRKKLAKECRRPRNNKIKPSLDNPGALSLASRMPAYFFVSGDIPALYQHQERAVLDALSRWPVRVLFADEVGLGKTFEAAATVTFLVKYCGVKRVLILTPKSVLSQWQSELHEHFGIDAWMYDSGKRSYVLKHGDGSSDTVKPVGKANPIGAQAPQLLLMSAQYARGSGKQGSIFEREGSVLPDLLVLDEAHSARISVDISGKRKATRMYKALEAVAGKIPHLILATATPMQRDSEEYHALLKLLGLPTQWQKSRKFKTSLRVIGDNEMPSLNDAAVAGRLLLATLASMKPSFASMNDGEIDAISALESIDKSDSYAIGEMVQKEWPSFQTAFIKLHPAQLLTVRNTRRSLQEVGYVFPKRRLHEVPVNGNEGMQIFYLKVNKYISDEYFSIERELYPDRKLNVGFVRISYQQRVSSSLHSCKKSLENRLHKVLALRENLKHGKSDSVTDALGLFDIANDFDAIDEDELLNEGKDLYEVALSNSDVNLDKLFHAVEVEATAISPLINEADELLGSCGDMKIGKSIDLALESLSRGDQVLLFSRYTDTVDALLESFCKRGANAKYAYGIYIGNKSVIVDAGVEQACTKDDIKTALKSGRVKIMFCSDAASEGLNLQAARVLINVDVPWTPARLEQRIGRIARLGQVAPSVDVYNVWYPDSVEARMYRRIQKRLDESNLAVGEFPEVVADGIKDLVLEDREQEDDSGAELQNIRNATQSQALSRLWSVKERQLTTSRVIRNELMQLCDENFACLEDNGDVKVYDLSGEKVKLTALEGKEESISLKSKPWQMLDFDLGKYGTVNDAQGNPAAFISKDDLSSWLKTECLSDIVHARQIDSIYLSGELPNTLADTGALNLEYTLDEDTICPNRPNFWPPVVKEEK